ncbi:hypothetical protein [Hyphomonas sp.]|jgi:hypothetical protein|uniref:hypothetical protein n=1 Tax=Hyphomonas sp. TaxID=87 RepID=UPI00300322A8
MILRRLTTALREQDWFTVVIETLIVVFGVFIGLQVNNWNEARVARGNEVLLLERLEEDFREAETAIAVAAAEAQQVAEDTGRLVELVRTHETPPDIDNLYQLLLAPALTSPLPTESATYLEMISTGSLSQIRDERLRRALTSYGQNIVRYDNNYQRALTAQSSTTASPLYIDAVRVNTEPSSATFIVDYDWAALRQAEPQLQTILVFQYNLASITQAQLDEVRTILALLAEPD